MGLKCSYGSARSRVWENQFANDGKYWKKRIARSPPGLVCVVRDAGAWSLGGSSELCMELGRGLRQAPRLPNGRKRQQK